MSDKSRKSRGYSREDAWGSKAIDRLSYDLKAAFPDMSGFSPRNLKYMRKFAEAWFDRGIVQRTIAQIPWWSNLALLDKLENPQLRLWYARKTSKAACRVSKQSKPNSPGRRDYEVGS